MTKPWIEEINQTEEFLRPLAEEGRVEAQASLGGLLAQKGLELLDSSLLDEAEQWYCKAAKAGDDSNREYLKSTWPFVKQNILEKINKTKDKSRIPTN
jgi:TPR repeat protein